MKYFFGKMTMYKDLILQARDMIMYFLEIYFPDKEEKLVIPFISPSLFYDITEFKNCSAPGHAPIRKDNAVLNQQCTQRWREYAAVFFLTFSPTLICDAVPRKPLAHA